MALLSFQFPQISRFFSAKTVFSILSWGEHTLLWGGLGLLIAINSLNLLDAPTSKLSILPVLSRPFSADRHMELAYTLRNLGLEAEANREAMLAQDISHGQAVLGVWEAQPAELKVGFTHWKTISEEKPDYRDAFVMAAVTAYQLNNQKEAVTLINRAYTLDPASPTVQELRAIITTK